GAEVTAGRVGYRGLHHQRRQRERRYGDEVTRVSNAHRLTPSGPRRKDVTPPGDVLPCWPRRKWMSTGRKETGRRKAPPLVDDRFPSLAAGLRPAALDLLQPRRRHVQQSVGGQAEP